MRELESSLQPYGEFLLNAPLVRPTAAPYFVRGVRRFLARQASDEPIADQVRGFCEELERNGGFEDWQLRQADQALRIYFVNFLKHTEWHRRPASTVVDDQGCTNRLAALEQLRTRVRTRRLLCPPSAGLTVGYRPDGPRLFAHSAGRPNRRCGGRNRRAIGGRNHLREITVRVVRRHPHGGWEADRAARLGLRPCAVVVRHRYRRESGLGRQAASCRAPGTIPRGIGGGQRRRAWRGRHVSSPSFLCVEGIRLRR